MKEIWKTISNTEGRYSVSNLGKVFDHKLNRELKLMWNGGFLACNVNYTDKRSLEKVHRLVAETFVPNPERANRVVHKDGDRGNNKADNLEWKLPEPPERGKGRKPWSMVIEGMEYSQEEIEKMCREHSCRVELFKGRIRSGWKLGDALSGENTKNYVQYKGITFKTKGDLRDFKVKERKEERRKRVLKKEEERIRRKKERKNFRKYGVGKFVNHPIVGIENRKANRIYRAWDGMLSRCYNKNNTRYPNYGEMGVYVEEEWHEFQNFAKWFLEQDKPTGWQIDKDILGGEIKYYGKDVCRLVPAEVNSFFTNSLARGETPHVEKMGEVFVIKVLGEMGRFCSRGEAICFYENKIRERAKELSEIDKLDPEISEALLNL